MSSTRSLLDKIKNRIRETYEAGLILENHMFQLNEALELGQLEFRVPHVITARLSHRQDTEYSFEILHCSGCGKLFYFFDVVNRTRLRCDTCPTRPPLSAAPIFVANFRDRPPRPIMFSEAIRKITLDENSRHCIYRNRPTPSGQRLSSNFIKGIRESDPNRPIMSLCWTCPIPEEPCEWRDQGFCRYSRYDGQAYRPDLWGDTGRIRVIPPPHLRRRSAFGVSADRYRPVSMSEGVTKPVKVAVHDYSSTDAKTLEFHRDILSGIESISFVSKLQILEFTVALAIGSPNTSIRYRPIRNFEETTSDGTDRRYVIARQLTTEGLVIRLIPETVTRIKEAWGQSRPDLNERSVLNILYHSISHAFLKPIPMLAGLDSLEFHESFSSSENEIAVFDNSPGGIGGVRSTVEESSNGFSLNVDYTAQLMNGLDCQLDCSWSCKACLHASACGWLNRQLHRDMLGEIFDERERDRYFGS